MKIKYSISLFLLAGAISYLLPQINKQNDYKISKTFSEIESALSKGNVDKLSLYLSNQTYFSLANNKNGYFSPNQAYYVLEDFFSNYRILSFKFNNLSIKEPSPYGYGTYSYEFRGVKKISKAYISLKNMGGNWKITQITIN